MLQERLDKGGYVRLETDRHYSVHPPAGARAALRIGSDTVLDLNGATLALAQGGYGSLIANRAPMEKTRIENGVIVGNGSLQPQVYKREIGITPTLYLMHCRRLELNNLLLRDAYMYAVYVHGNDGMLDHVNVAGAVGGGIHVNGARWRIDGIDVRDVTYFEKVNCQGNPFIVCLKDSVIGSVHCENYSFGVKLQDGCENVRVDKIVAVAGANNWSFPDHLVKVQGKKDPSHERRNRGIRIGRIESSNGPMSGLYVYFSSDVAIGTYLGRNNGQSNPQDAKIGSDILVMESDDIRFHEIDAAGFPRHGIWLHRDCGKVTAEKASFVCNRPNCPDPVIVWGGEAWLGHTRYAAPGGKK